MGSFISLRFRKRPRYYLGNFLIIFSLSFALFVYYPLITSFFIQPAHSQNSFYILIPKINAQAPIIKNVNPWDKNQYSQALKKGVAQAAGFAPVGGRGTTFLFAHSSAPPWIQTRENTAFLRLGELSSGDIIDIYKDSKKYQYQVYDKKIVSPENIKKLGDLKRNQLILQTCTPIGTDWNRLLIFAKPISGY